MLRIPGKHSLGECPRNFFFQKHVYGDSWKFFTCCIADTHGKTLQNPPSKHAAETPKNRLQDQWKLVVETSPLLSRNEKEWRSKLMYSQGKLENLFLLGCFFWKRVLGFSFLPFFFWNRMGKGAYAVYGSTITQSRSRFAEGERVSSCMMGIVPLPGKLTSGGSGGKGAGCEESSQSRAWLGLRAKPGGVASGMRRTMREAREAQQTAGRARVGEGSPSTTRGMAP